MATLDPTKEVLLTDSEQDGELEMTSRLHKQDAGRIRQYRMVTFALSIALSISIILHLANAFKVRDSYPDVADGTALESTYCKYWSQQM